MNCTRCNAPLEEDALYCKSCGTQHAVLEQKAKIEGITANIKGLIVTKLKSPLFLVAAILFSIMFASTISSVFSGGFAGIAGSILSFIFMLIATIGMWKGYASKTPADAASALRKASIYDAYQRVMYTISIVLTSIMGHACGKKQTTVAPVVTTSAPVPEGDRQAIAAAVAAAIAEELGTDITGIRIVSMKKL